MMYLLDPDIGLHRRRWIRDRLLQARNQANRWLFGQFRYAAGELRGSLLREGPLPDRTLERRVRAQLGRVVARSRSLEIIVQNGHVTIRGAVEPGERERILDRLSAIRGVFEFTLDVSERPAA
jgi:hypothetical protein